ncbi:MAG: hypothetical protein IT233_14140 [Bacteroidia bacterium]|nr:hypothetical protein [Bacteroidia bacterium]
MCDRKSTFKAFFLLSILSTVISACEPSTKEQEEERLLNDTKSLLAPKRITFCDNEYWDNNIEFKLSLIKKSEKGEFQFKDEYEMEIIIDYTGPDTIKGLKMELHARDLYGKFAFFGIMMDARDLTPNNQYRLKWRNIEAIPSTDFLNTESLDAGITPEGIKEYNLDKNNIKIGWKLLDAVDVHGIECDHFY